MKNNKYNIKYNNYKIDYMKLEKNIGPKNRIARLIAGLILISASLYYSNNWSIIGDILGAILVLESIFSYCIIHGIRGTKDMR